MADALQVIRLVAPMQKVRDARSGNITSFGTGDAINARGDVVGQIVGDSTLASGDSHAALWSR